jgi:hypothetical protein
MILWLKADLHRGKRDRRTTKEIFEVLKQAIKVGASGALPQRLKEQRQVEQSY